MGGRNTSPTWLAVLDIATRDTGVVVSRIRAAAPEPVDADVVDTITGALMLSLAVAIIAVVLIAVSRRPNLAISIEGALITPAAICSIGAATIHFWVGPEHFREYPAFGMAFFLLASFQAAWGLGHLRPALRPVLRIAGLAVNAAAVAVWVWSRSVGLPFGPAPGVPEAIAGSDLAAVGFEAVLVGLLALAVIPQIRDGLMARRIGPARAVEVRSLAASIVTLLTFLALAGQGHGHS